MISIIVAVAENNTIGADNKLIWHLPDDLKRFKEITIGNAILMGRKTWESIGRALPGRTSIVITRNPDYKAEGAIIAGSLSEAISKVSDDQKIFIIGGGEIYEQAMRVAGKIYLTRVNHSFEGDTFFPEINSSVWEKVSEVFFEADEKNPYSFSFIEYLKRKH